MLYSIQQINYNFNYNKFLLFILLNLYELTLANEHIQRLE